MGIKNLNLVIKESMKRTTFDKLRGSIIGVDFSLFLYRFIYNKNNPIECFLRQLHMFFRYKILPVYVIDGNAPLEKKVTLDKRAQKRQKLYDNIADLLEKQQDNNSPNTSSRIKSEITKLERRCVIFSQKLIKDILYFFELLGIPVIHENEEADFILAKLSAANKIHYILSDDSDVLAFGAKRVLKNFCIKEEKCEIFIMDNILANLGVTMNKFVDICIMCGCDYMTKIRNMNCGKSLQLILEWGSIEEVAKNTDFVIDLEKIQKARELFGKELSEETMERISASIVKKDCKLEELEKFLRANIEKKFLIPIFIHSIFNIAASEQLSDNIPSFI
jgi:flap endonuclease-1